MDRYDRQNLTEKELEQYKDDLDNIEYLISRMEKVKKDEISPIPLVMDSYIVLREAHFTESEALKLTELISNSYYKDLKCKALCEIVDIINDFANKCE